MTDDDGLRKLGELRAQQISLHKKWINSELGKATYLAKESYNDIKENDCITDLQGIVYSRDRKCLVDIPFESKYCSIKEGTEIINWRDTKLLRAYVGHGNTTLQYVQIPNSVWGILSGSFANCMNLRFVSLGKGLRIIDNYAFDSCDLNIIDVPEGVQHIGKEAFARNKHLTMVSLPSSIEYIDSHVFDDCSQLSLIYVPKTIKKKFETMLPSYSDKLIETDFSTWDEENTVKAFKRSFYMKKQLHHNTNYCLLEDEYQEDYSDEGIWDAMTDGVYGDYPDDGFDGDYEFMGY